MKTDELITALSLGVEPVDRRRVDRTVGVALVVGTLVAVVGVLVGLGVRDDVTTPRAAVFLTMKLAFALSTAGVASVYLARAVRPGGERNVSFGLAAIPFVTIMLLAAVSLGQAPSSHWDRMLLGSEWLECVLSIPVIAIVPFALAI